MILVIDNYDSFTYNLVQYIGKHTKNIVVYKNNKITIEELRGLPISRILISPGPKSPSEAGISKLVIDYFKNKVPILGVCLGHQAVGEVFGGMTVHAPYVMHGKPSKIFHDGKGIFKGIKQGIPVGRYHSLVIDPHTFPKDELVITARTEDNIIMGVRHKQFPVEAVQFHPESIITQNGLMMMENFLQM
ncbi:anthranilate synthase component II [Paenibacillus rhizophilus]|uniref:Aminodeoxychorismate/anthranilate synthase component II n=1 Tax=Paenibacillus rhizophilus TaxID=1850366 RepID=A0A3N9Q3V8_9BACL|nr:aminodeoxychorismate/anthranilate synthase component II [Paenibacillus rhizophilus]RQW13432.1 aminodeoxychorismate/anthranilate synthase component II [Paenibacillus rhizophilus]